MKRWIAVIFLLTAFITALVWIATAQSAAANQPHFMRAERVRRDCNGDGLSPVGGKIPPPDFYCAAGEQKRSKSVGFYE